MPNSNTTVVEGLMHEVRQLKKDIADLNRLLRDVGWGQGEIDTAAVIAEENEQLRAALSNLLDAAKSKEFEKWCCDEAGMAYYCGGCGNMDYSGHTPDCPYAAAIAEAERLLGDAT